MPLFCWIIAALFASGAVAQGLSGFGEARIRIFEGPNAQLRLRINDTETPLPSTGPITRDGLTLTPVAEALHIRTLAQPALIEAPSLGRW
jgi:hypothetical protein